MQTIIAAFLIFVYFGSTFTFTHIFDFKKVFFQIQESLLIYNYKRPGSF